MEQLISLRPTPQIIGLFERIKEYDIHPQLDRSSIVNRALYSASSREVDWNLVASSKITDIEKKAEPSLPDHIRFNVEKKLYEKISLEIKSLFSLKRISAPYFIRLLLTFYLSEISKTTNEDNNEAINHITQMIDFGIDFLVFKKEFDSCTCDKKEKLYLTSKKYLEEFDPHLNKKIRDQINLKIKSYSDFFNIEKYYPKPRANFGQCNIVVATKVFAGLLITLSEIDGLGLGEIIESLESLMVDNGKTN